MTRLDYFALVEDTEVSALDDLLKNGRVDLYSYLLLAHARECRRGDVGGPAEREGSRGALDKVAHRFMTHQKDRTRQNSRFSRNLLTDPGAAADSMKRLGLVGLGEGLLGRLPEGSVLLEFAFKLEKPYVSRDDAAFYPIDNPVRKERIFKAPYVAGSSWKGSLRAAAVEGLLLREQTGEERVAERLDLIDVFGDEKAAPEIRRGGGPARYAGRLPG